MPMTEAQRCEAYRRMLRIRKFEEAAIREAKAGKVPGTLHVSIGQEAAIVGACMALRDDDTMTGTHRSHGHPIGKGADLKALMAELMGKETGICKGRGGSMHLADNSVGIVSESAIVGGGIPIATGCGLSAKVRRSEQLSLCFFGDGAVNQGMFHESLNMASLWKLPVIYLCENNGYAVTTSVAQSHAEPSIATRSKAYAMPGIEVDGQDVCAVYEATSEAAERARRGEGPTLIEAKTYRFDEHSMGLLVSGKPYRQPEEIAHYKENRDPIVLFRRALLAEGLSEAELESIENEVDEAVDAAVEFGNNGAQPDPEALYEFMFSHPIDYPFQRSRKRKSVDAGEPGTAQWQSAIPTTRMNYMEALIQAQIEELERDERVILMGEDITVYNGGGRLVDRFGSGRIWAMPISETSFTGVGIGAAIAGLRPIVDLTIASFMYLASDQIINQAAKLRFMTGGQIKVPIVFRCCMYYGSSSAAQHSDRPYSLFMNIPGLKILCPTNPADGKGLLKSAVRDDDPVIIFEDTKMWALKDDVPTDTDYVVPIGKAAIRRAGTDVTIVAIAAAMRPTLEAAKALAEEGISVEVVDLRTLKPLDTEAIITSVAKTGRLVVVDNAHLLCSVASEIAATVVQEGFEYLKRPIVRLTAPDVHVAFSPALENQLYPNRDKIIAAVRGLI